MKYIVIGLGNYGSVVAEELTLLGHEVIGVDRHANKVELIKDKVATSFILDATDEQSLSILPLRAVDVVIVSIGEAFGESIKVVALLKKIGVKHIYARAIDDVHKMVLESFNIDSILSPEKEAARSLVQLLDLNVNVESFKIDKEHYIIKFRTPKPLIGFKISEIAVEREFNLRIISLLKGEKVINDLGIFTLNSSVVNKIDENYTLEEDDSIVCYGKYKDFISFWKAIS